jgi:vacuolar-type H+-ATPase subunit I/STV1
VLIVLLLAVLAARRLARLEERLAPWVGGAIFAGIIGIFVGIVFL